MAIARLIDVLSSTNSKVFPMFRPHFAVSAVAMVLALSATQAEAGFVGDLDLTVVDIDNAPAPSFNTDLSPDYLNDGDPLPPSDGIPGFLYYRPDGVQNDVELAPLFGSYPIPALPGGRPSTDLVTGAYIEFTFTGGDEDFSPVGLGNLTTWDVQFDVSYTTGVPAYDAILDDLGGRDVEFSILENATLGDFDPFVGDGFWVLEENNSDGTPSDVTFFNVLLDFYDEDPTAGHGTFLWLSTIDYGIPDLVNVPGLEGLPHDFDGGEIELVITAGSGTIAVSVPTPAAAGLLFAGLGIAALARRR